MKKIIIISLVFVLACSSSFAQSKWGFGPKIGVNVSTATKSDAGYKAGMFVGAFANYRMNDFFGVQPELLFSMQGAKSDGGKLKLNYINVPVMAKAYLYKGLSLELGPQFGFNVGSKYNGYIITDDVNTFDFAIGVGLGYEFECGLTAGFRYNASVTKITSDFDGNGSKNSVLQFGIGWKF